MCCQANSIDEVSLANLALMWSRMVVGDMQIAAVLILEEGIGALRAFESLFVSTDSQVLHQVLWYTCKPTIKTFGKEYGMCETGGVGGHVVGFGKISRKRLLRFRQSCRRNLGARSSLLPTGRCQSAPAALKTNFGPKDGNSS